MTAMQEEPQMDESHNSLQLQLDHSMQLLFTGYFNGLNVEVRAAEEMLLLYHMGCFGKGSQSRSRPQASHGCHRIMRKRQFAKRSFWHKKFDGQKTPEETDQFLKDVMELSSQLKSEKGTVTHNDVIDLISSDEDNSEKSQEGETVDSALHNGDDDIVVVVPNSDSEGENYFENFKPKCCINRTVLDEKLMLTLQEAFFLTYALGCLQIIGSDNNLLSVKQAWTLFEEIENDFAVKYAVYHYFKSKGYILKPGIKFGGDYLLYRDQPAFAHADYIVVIRNKIQSGQNWTQQLGHLRMAATTVKDILIAEVTKCKETNIGTEMPEALKQYSVREIVISRNPLKINDEIIDYIFL